MMLEQLLNKYSHWAALPLRITVGIIFIAHGSQKLFGLFGGYGLNATANFFEQNIGFAPGILWAGLAGFGELIGGILLVLGLFTRWGALLISIIMAVAILKVHLQNGLFADKGGFEYPLTLLAAALSLILSGPQSGSIDLRIRNNKTPKTEGN